MYLFNTIQNVQKERRKLKKQAYASLLNDVEKTIIEEIHRDNRQCYYTIPVVTFGQPVYDAERLIIFLKKFLKRQKIKVTHIGDFVIHLDWSNINIINNDLEELYKRYR